MSEISPINSAGLRDISTEVLKIILEPVDSRGRSVNNNSEVSTMLDNLKKSSSSMDRSAAVAVGKGARNSRLLLLVVLDGRIPAIVGSMDGIAGVD